MRPRVTSAGCPVGATCLVSVWVSAFASSGALKGSCVCACVGGGGVQGLALMANLMEHNVDNRQVRRYGMGTGG